MTNTEQLRQLIVDIFLIDPKEFRFDLRLEDIETWDSLGIVSIAVGVQEIYGHHMSPDQAMKMKSIGDIVAYLESKGVHFEPPTDLGS